MSGPAHPLDALAARFDLPPAAPAQLGALLDLL